MLKPEEEEKIKQHVLYKAQIGYGDSWVSLQKLVQKILLKVKKVSPDRITGLEEVGQRPCRTWVRRFAERQGISLRKCSIISKGRAVISPRDIRLWFEDVGPYLHSKPEILEALQDPSRILNQDETAVEHGVEDQWVLSRKGEKQTYGVSSCTREHTTISFTVNAAGGVVEPRVRDGLTGKWKYSYTSNGWVKQSTYLHIVKDLVDYLKRNKIPLPVLLLIDGATCHLSYEMAKLCKENNILPILLSPNTTHLCQVLDLTYFAGLKAGLKVEQENWHREPQNIGTALNKYTIVPLVHRVAERLLKDKPHLIAKGFRKAGIVPWNPLAPTAERMAPSLVYTRESEERLPQPNSTKAISNVEGTEKDNGVQGGTIVKPSKDGGVTERGTTKCVSWEGSSREEGREEE